MNGTLDGLAVQIIHIMTTVLIVAMPIGAAGRMHGPIKAATALRTGKAGFGDAAPADLLKLIV
jgi:hypothetical protein